MMTIMSTMMMTIFMMEVMEVFSEVLSMCVVLSLQASLRSRLCGARWGFHSILACLALAALPKCQILLYCKINPNRTALVSTFAKSLFTDL